MHFEILLWEHMKVGQRAVVALDHSSADDYGYFASVALVVLVRGNSSVC